MSASPSSSLLPASPPIFVPSSATAKQPQEDSADKEDSSTTSASNAVSARLSHDGPAKDQSSNASPPPLPSEVPPPLPNEEPPKETNDDDGWDPIWDESAQAFYFFNRFTQKSQWENPRIPQSIESAVPRVTDTGPPGATHIIAARAPVAGGYDPAIHGDYDPNADYAKIQEPESTGLQMGQNGAGEAAGAYAATGAFNRFTGKWQSADLNPENYSDESKSRRQMNAFFDVDAAANSHDGRSLKAERSGKKLTKAELKAFREKRREKKEEKRRAWLRD